MYGNKFVAVDAVDIDPEATIWDPAAGKRFMWTGAMLSSSVAGKVTFKDNTAGTVIAILYFAANGSPSLIDLGVGIRSAAADNVLTATGPAAALLTGTLIGYEE